MSDGSGRTLRLAARGARVAALVALVLGLAGTSGASAPSEVRQQVRGTLDEVLAVLGDASLSDEQRREKVEAIAFAQFDFDTMARLVLARNWKKLSQEERETFVVEFKHLLSRSYGTRLDRFSNERVEVTGEQEEPRGDVTVMTRVVGGKYDDARVHFRMRKRPEGWRAIDVVIEGVSLVANYRSQFADVMSRSGVAGLLEQMREKNVAPISIRENDEAG